MSEDIKYVEFQGRTVSVKKGKDGFWHDPDGTLYAYAGPDYAGIDADNRCGVGFFSLPNSDIKLNEACKPHDYAYSSPVYQEFHNRSEAEDMLENNIELEEGPVEGKVLGALFEGIAYIFGGSFWENLKTRWK